jgi:hypothetical protein
MPGKPSMVLPVKLLSVGHSASGNAYCRDYSLILSNLRGNGAVAILIGKIHSTQILMDRLKNYQTHPFLGLKV